MLQRLFWLFQCFRNTQCIHIELLIILASHQIISYAFTHWYILVSHCKTPYPRWYGTASLTFFYYKTTLSSHPKCWYPSCYCYFTVKTSQSAQKYLSSQMRSSKAKQYCSVAVSKNIQKQVRKVDQIEEKICFPSKTSCQFSVLFSFPSFTVHFYVALGG